MKTKSFFFALSTVYIMLFMAFIFLCPPTVPVLKPTVDNTVGKTKPPTIVLEWYPSIDECTMTYHIQVATDPNFEDVLVNENGISETSYGVSNLQNSTTHYWRVRAHCKPGGNSGWSEVGHFTTENK